MKPNQPSHRISTPNPTSGIECPAAKRGLGASTPAAAHRSRREARIAIEVASSQLRDPESFAEKVQKLYDNPEPSSYDVIEHMPPIPPEFWAVKAEIRRRAESARAVLGRHRWAIGLLESLRPDVVFSDVRLPGMTGIELLRRIREFDASPEKVFRAHADPDLFARWCGPKPALTGCGSRQTPVGPAAPGAARNAGTSRPITSSRTATRGRPRCRNTRRAKAKGPRPKRCLRPRAFCLGRLAPRPSACGPRKSADRRVGTAR